MSNREISPLRQQFASTSHGGGAVGTRAGLTRRLLLCAFALAVLLGAFAAKSWGQSCSSCNKEVVSVGFTASACSSHSYAVTLNNTTANGSGSCTANSWVTAPEAYTDLEVDLTYQLVAGEGSCSTHIVFDLPEKYYVEVNGVRTKTIDVGGTTKGSGDGVWNITVRKCNQCEDSVWGQTCSVNMGSVDWSVSLGKLSDGRSAQNISIREDFIGASVYTPAALTYSPPGQTTEVDAVRNQDGSLRQVKTTQSLADVVVVSAQEYDIRFYSPSAVGAKVGGVYTVSGQPSLTWKIKNPDPSSTARLQISKIEGGATAEIYEYAWDAVSNTWSLAEGGGGRSTTKLSASLTTTSRVETTVVKDAGGKVSSKVARTYHTYAWGEEILQEVIDPDGAALTTGYAYYEDPSEAGRYRKLKSVTYPDGSWEKYDYNGNGKQTLVMRPWKDLSLASATEANSYTINYTYSNNDGIQVSLYPDLISSITEKVAGTAVRKTTFSRVGTQINGEPAVVETKTVYDSSSSAMSSSVMTYHPNASAFYANRVAATENADGTKSTYAYEKGDFAADPNDPSLSQFTPNPNGAAQRETVVHGTSVSPGGVALKTTKETAVRDQYGRVVLQEVYVFSGAGYERVAWAAMDYDTRGHLTQTRCSNGEVSSATWGGDRKLSDVNSAGVETDYTYDEVGRVKTTTKKGVPAGGAYPAQPDITVTYTYDADGRVTAENVSGGGLTLSHSSVYDVAGRVKSETDEAGLTTTYSYDNGGRTRTVVYPGGATETASNYLDGQTKSVTGTAVVARYFDYGANADGTRYTQEFTGGAALDSPRWQKFTSDWLGRTVKIESPTFTGAVLTLSGAYNIKGQLVSKSASVGPTKLQADALNEYDELGQMARTGLDVDGDGVLTPSSADRIVEYERSFRQEGGDWFAYVASKTYLADNDATSTEVRARRERLSNFPSAGGEKTISEVKITDASAVVTTTSTSVNRAARAWSVRVSRSPLSNTDAVRVTVNGLLQSETANVPQSATTYSYDGLGRLTGVSDPRSGASTKSYHPTTGQLTAETDGAQSMAYEYYAAADANAGRLKSSADSFGKKTYFGYNGRGDMTRTWGDAVYPVEYVYDEYGQRQEMHTFRGGFNWSSSVWPSATTGAADVTRRIYNEPTGLLEKTRDAAGKEMSYGYDALGRIVRRTWARLDSLGNPVSATHSYDPVTGALAGIDYSDSTPDVAFAYDRAARTKSVTDAAGTHTFTLNQRGELKTEQIAGGILDLVQVSTNFDANLRRQSSQAAYGGSVVVSQTYGYDSASRLETITSGGQAVTYTYQPATGLLDATAYTGGSNTAKGYDSFGRLKTVVTTPASGGAQSFTYTYNGLNQRTRATREDGSYWAFGYDGRGQVTSGKKFWPDDKPVFGQQAEYAFDGIGNRTSALAGGDPLGRTRQSSYVPNALNQYVQRGVPGAVDVTGTANGAATVTVNDQAAARQGDYFYKELAVANSVGPVYAQVRVVGARNNFSAGGEDAVTESGGRVYVPQATESYTYDADGNLTSDGRWLYAWDAENRLVRMDAAPGVPAEARRRLEFSYDYKGRRIQKKVYDWNAAASAYQLQSVTRFVYDGWNLVAELDGAGAPVRTYVWGPEGVHFIGEAGNTYVAAYDGNNNVIALVKAATGALAALYEYDAFGNTVKSVGEYAGRNPLKFSGQYEDQETGLVYYGYRYYNPQTGRWVSRDPSGERGGLNLYGFLQNDGVNGTDFLGLWKRDGEWTGKWSRYSGSATAEACDSLSHLAELITGEGGDARFLGISANIVPGQRVNIAPLLKRLESKLRDSVVRATRLINTEGFGDASVTVTADENTASAVNSYFGPNPYGRPDCDTATRLVLAKGLLDVVGAGDFNKLGFSDGNLPLVSKTGRSTDMLLGDTAWFPNYPDYLDQAQDDPGNQAFQAENVIKVGPGKFWGFLGGRRYNKVLTAAGWRDELRSAYQGVSGVRRRDPIPGWDRLEIRFLDAAGIAMQVFDERNKK